MSHSRDFSLDFQWESLDGAERLLTTEEVVDEGSWERSGAVDYGIRLLLLRSFTYFHALLGSKRLYGPNDEELLKWNAAKLLQLTALALSSVCFALARTR